MTKNRPLLFAVLALALAVPAAAQEAETKPAEGQTGPAKDAFMQIDEFIAQAGIDKEDPAWRTKLPKPEMVTFEDGRDYIGIMETSQGTVRIKLLPDVAPMHVTAFMYFAKLGYYDGLTFHRVITNFMAQGSCPEGTGRGGPGFRMKGEYSSAVRHTRGGLLSAANSGPGTDGSQFFLTFVETPWLDDKHTIYGEVVGGMETLKDLEKRGSRSGATSETLHIKKVTVE